MIRLIVLANYTSYPYFTAWSWAGHACCIVVDDQNFGGHLWNPKRSSPRFQGP